MPLMERREDRRPWGLIVALIVAAAAGVVSIPLQILTYNGLNAATSQDVERNLRLVEQVKLLEEMNAQNVDDHRDANQHDHDCIVSLALLLADPTRDRTVPPDLPVECEGAPAIGDR